MGVLICDFNILHKSLKGFHAGFYVNVCQGDVDCGCAYVRVAKNAAKSFDVFCLSVVLCSIAVSQGVGCDVFGNTGFLGISFYHLLNVST